MLRPPTMMRSLRRPQRNTSPSSPMTPRRSPRRAARPPRSRRRRPPSRADREMYLSGMVSARSSRGSQMILKRLSVTVAAVVTAVLGLSLAAVSPAVAASGAWRSYGTDPVGTGRSLWSCGAYKAVTTNVTARACAIRSATSNTSVQGAVVVRNDRSSLYSVEAATDLSNSTLSTFYGRWTCSSSGVGAHTWSVCYGVTISVPVRVVSGGGANGVNLGVSPPI